nr:MAG TPA: hypothetical protein [Caudoviricetes sp.]
MERATFVDALTTRGSTPKEPQIISIDTVLRFCPRPKQSV